jgi:undecaprenyl-diphosphatase
VIAWLLRADEQLFRRIGSFRHRALVASMRALTHFGDAQSWIVVALFLLACGGNAARYGLLLGTAAALAAALSQVVKRSLRRPRPSARGFEALIENPDAFSFPSGHAASAFAVAVALAGQGYGLGPLALVLAGAIGISRVYLGAHYPLDVAVGAVLGCGCGALARLFAP